MLKIFERIPSEIEPSLDVRRRSNKIGFEQECFIQGLADICSKLVYLTLDVKSIRPRLTRQHRFDIFKIDNWKVKICVKLTLM